MFAIQVNEISKLLCDVLYSNPNLPIVGQEWDPRTGVYRSDDGRGITLKDFEVHLSNEAIEHAKMNLKAV